MDLRYISDISDYINGMYANRTDLEEIKMVLKRLKNDPKVNSELFFTLKCGQILRTNMIKNVQKHF